MWNAEIIRDLIKAKYRSEHKSIQRVISDDKDPITEVCINLRIVSRKSAKDKEVAFAGHDAMELRDQQLKAYSSLYEESQLELKEAIDIEKIFSNGAKKVAVYGRAGIGKSTLCQYLTVKWQEGNLWGKEFEAVIWLPLRDLVDFGHQDGSSYLARIVREKCIAGVEEDKPSTAHIRDYLSANRNKVLIILDGYDEVVHSLTPELKQLLGGILSDPYYHAIVTSRPITIAIDDKQLHFDKELESVGFTKENIKNYIKQFYSNKQDELIEFIETNRHIRNIAHIPLNLELICSVWSPTINQEKYTVTRVYQDIVKHLFERMAKKEVYECDEARQVLLTEALGELALVGMSDKKSIILPVDVKAVLQGQAKEELLEQLLNVGIIKSVSKNKCADDNPIYFIHHTFQEYFAAIAIAKGFESYIGDDAYKQALAMLKEHKYTPYYEVMWISVVGELYASCNKSGDYLPLFQFWDAFEREPRELLGLKHDTLKLKLVEECPPLKNPPKALQSLNAAIIDLERVAEELFKIIESNEEPVKRLHAMEALVSLNMKKEKVIPKLEVVMRKDKVEGVMVYAAESILRLGSGSKEALRVLLKASEHLKEYKQAALTRVYALEDLEPGIKDEIGKLKGDNNQKLDQVDFIKLALEPELGVFVDGFNRNIDVLISPGYVNQGITSLLGTALVFGIGYASVRVGGFDVSQIGTIRKFIGTYAIGGLVSSTAAAYTIVTATALELANNYYKKTFPSVASILDNITMNEKVNKLKAICEKANNNTKTAIAWSKEGMLNISLAIRLYSYASQTALWNKSKGIWLEPMKDIKFIYKDASIFITITNKLIRDKTEPLTKNWDETKEVLKAMREAYTNAELPAKLMDHYLNGTSLDVSSDKEKLEIARRIRSTRPMAFTPLHKAAENGELIEVKKLVEAGEIDINDFNNHNWETPLIVAIKNAAKNGKWDVVEYLVDKGADVNLGGAIHLVQNNYQIFASMLKRAPSINGNLLERALNFAVDDYALQKQNIVARAEIINRLAIIITGLDINWMNCSSKSSDQYRMYLGNEKSKVRDGVGDVNSEGHGADEMLLMRLHAYTMLYIKLSAYEIHNLPELNERGYMSLEETLAKLMNEIKVTTQSLLFAKVLFKFTDMRFDERKELIEKLERVYADAIVRHLCTLTKGEEYIVTSVSGEHCIYVALHKLDEKTVLVRIDNRWLTGGLDNKTHGKPPYKISGNIVKIKSFCVKSFNLESEASLLTDYIFTLFTQKLDNARLLPIYGSAIPYKDLQEGIQKQVDTWPYHVIQADGNYNCTLSSYNLGISVRQGMKFFEWLIGKEQQIIPPLTSVNKPYKAKPSSSLSVVMKGGDNTANHTHTELMKKFQQALNAPYSEVLVGIVVEQAIVGLAGITTNQSGASFRQHDSANTVFHLNFKDEGEYLSFIDYYNKYFPGVIVEPIFKKENGQISIVMNTRKLYEEVASTLGKVHNNNNHKENSNAKLA